MTSYFTVGLAWFLRCWCGYGRTCETGVKVCWYVFFGARPPTSPYTLHLSRKTRTHPAYLHNSRAGERIHSNVSSSFRCPLARMLRDPRSSCKMTPNRPDKRDHLPDWGRQRT
ncbi:hypothetical protein LXA43DRAFT_710940 [Ganoderma leucocontextum]|nr:hypothetical protein LXA43DRAFT_710940 [Ganoderma leucocontextum]